MNGLGSEPESSTGHGATFSTAVQARYQHFRDGVYRCTGVLARLHDSKVIDADGWEDAGCPHFVAPASRLRE